MVQINLLPWREEARRFKLKKFLVAVAASAIASLLILLMGNLYLRHLISVENRRMDYIQTAFGEKQSEFAVLRDEKNKQTEIEAQLKYLSHLRQNTVNLVNLMNELNSSVPAAVTLDKVRRINNKITLEGKAESAVDITQFMKKLSKSNYFDHPVLSKINADPANTAGGKMFQIEVEQQREALP